RRQCGQGARWSDAPSAFSSISTYGITSSSSFRTNHQSQPRKIFKVKEEKIDSSGFKISNEDRKYYDKQVIDLTSSSREKTFIDFVDKDVVETLDDSDSEGDSENEGDDGGNDDEQQQNEREPCVTIKKEKNCEVECKYKAPAISTDTTDNSQLLSEQNQATESEQRFQDFLQNDLGLDFLAKIECNDELLATTLSRRRT
ncbi:unnamed protein product, partial [Didymodactylos carnosus]